MKKILVRIISAAAALITAAALVSCSSGYSDDEIITAAAELIEASYDINNIFFGKGLPTVAKSSEEALSFVAENGVDVDSVMYLPVDTSCGYTTEEDVMSAAARVYSAKYCEYLQEIGFTGVSDNDTGAAVYARYIEDSGGNITVKTDIADSALALDRTYDTDTIAVSKNTKSEIKVSVQSNVDGEKDQILEFALVNESGGWRLDTPTY